MRAARALSLSLFTSLSLAAPSAAQNDECAGALALPLGQTAFDTTAATPSATPWPCLTGTIPDLWYVFTAPTAGVFNLETCGSGFDTGLEVFQGGCAALTSLACNDDACGLQSRVGVIANAGDVFHVRVGGYNGATGLGTLAVVQSLPVLNPANGHYYQAVPVTLDWNAADAFARSMNYLGLPGHLATVSDAAEDQFIYFTLNGAALGNAWLGGYQDMNSPTFSEPAGGWTWVTGEPFVYTNWTAGEPNNSTGGTEHYLGYWPADQWNDYAAVSANVGVFVVEFESSNLGTSYCSPAVTNSTGAGAEIHATGSSDVAVNDVTLHAERLPHNTFAFFLTSQVQGLVMGPGGSQGTLCLGGAIGRYIGPGQVQNAGAAGAVSLHIDLTLMPSPTGFLNALPGSTWRFQCWFRDANPTITSNFTDAVRVTF